jgi:hypothetical protein
MKRKSQLSKLDEGWLQCISSVMEEPQIVSSKTKTRTSTKIPLLNKYRGQT